jgi:hypothetical protein
MHDQNQEMTVEGRVSVIPPEDPEDWRELIVFIHTDGGHGIRVEPSYVGLYLGRFDGALVRAEGELVKHKELGDVLRIDCVTMIDRSPPIPQEEGHARNPGAKDKPTPLVRDQDFSR